MGDICCMIIDSYDRSKCMLPKFPHGGRSPKHPTYETIKRALEVGLIWWAMVHGYGVYIYVADEDVSTGASWTIEVAFWQQGPFAV